MPGGPSRRFARDDDSSIAIDGDRLEAELLQRLEDQAAALADTKSRLAMLESALDAERKVRLQLTEELKAGQAKVQQLGGSASRAQAAAAQVTALEEELDAERANSESLGLRLQEAWTEIQSLKEALHRPRGKLRRRADAAR